MSWRSIGASAALHLMILVASWLAGRHILDVKPARDSKELDLKKALSVRNISEKEFVDEVNAMKKLQHKEQVVQMDEELKSQLAPNSRTQEIYLSKYNQRVDRNQRAQRVGAFKNALEEGILSGDAAAKAEATAAAGGGGDPKPTKKGMKAVTADPSKLFALASKFDNTPEFEDGEAKALNDAGRDPSSILTAGNAEQKVKKGNGISATDDYLEGVSIGPNTLLNTQEFKYYSFYERIRHQLVDRWRARIRREIETARRIASGDGALKTGSKITSLAVKLDETGALKNIEKIGISGIERFDQAAITSFGEAAPFPHPPKEMLKDGLLTIRWDFVVLVEEASMVDFKVMRR